MTEQTSTPYAPEHPADDLVPAPPEPARTTPRAKKWLAGAALVTAGVVAGSGATYAITIQTVSGTGQSQFSGQGGPGGMGGRMGQPPGTQADGQQQGTQQQGTQPQTG